MITQKMYRYLGRNGTITSRILLENISPIEMISLQASQGKILTNGEEQIKIKTLFLDELEEWYEIDDPSVKKD